MSALATISWDRLADWVTATDVHARHRVGLLKRAQRILDGAEPAPIDVRHDLAHRLERWRYQLLNEHGGHLEPSDQQLADTLDTAANALAGRPDRPPRAARQAVRDSGRALDRVQRAMACLDAAEPLQRWAQHAAEITAAHFTPRGSRRRRILLYAPLYLSSHCVNHCVYCGFRFPGDVVRRHLGHREAVRQAEILIGRGLHHLLLVAGDFPSLATTEYYTPIIRSLRQRQVSVAVEIAPQSTAGYAALVEAGICGVTLYQETYDEDLYARYHPRGPKTSFDWRLEGLERAAEAGVKRLGLGILLGLAPAERDLAAMIRHASYLAERFPGCTIAFSLPRIRQAPAGFRIPYPVSEEMLLRMYCALRVAFPTAELVLSTRESPDLRDRLATIAVTQLSAGSSTVPGGYDDGAACSAAEQFPVFDHRTPAEVAARLEAAGLEVAWDISA